MKLIDANGVTVYNPAQNAAPAIDALSFSVDAGELVAVLGASGSGKSTLALALNAMLPISAGALTVVGYDVRDEKRRGQIRKSCGVVLQGLDEHFIAPYIFEELAFAPRCFGVEEDKIPARVKAALAEVNMSGYERRSPQLLNGGQKARVALAAVLAQEPDIIVLDSVTDYLTPNERRELMGIILRLKAHGHTIIMLSDNAEEAVSADRVIILDAGRKLAEGAPRDILTDKTLMDKAGLAVPFAAQLAHALESAGAWRGELPLMAAELVEEVCR